MTREILNVENYWVPGIKIYQYEKVVKSVPSNLATAFTAAEL